MPVVVLITSIVPPAVVDFANNEPAPPREKDPVAVVPPAIVVVPGHRGSGGCHHHQQHRKHRENHRDPSRKSRPPFLGDPRWLSYVVEDTKCGRKVRSIAYSTAHLSGGICEVLLDLAPMSGTSRSLFRAFWDGGCRLGDIAKGIIWT